MGTVSHRILLALLIFWTAACAGGPDLGSSPSMGSGGLASGIYRVADGSRVSEEVFFADVVSRRYVIVGEQHDRVWHHEVQRRVLEGMLERHRGPIALGMEMFQWPYQGALGAYIAAEIDEERMLEETEYASRWGFDVAFYRPLWRAMREHGHPVLALNAPRELSRAVAEVGVDGLDEEKKSWLPQMDLEHEVHRAYVRRAWAAHGMAMEEGRFERFYQAQVLWDETMAERAVRFMRAHQSMEAVMVVAGIAHADARFGIAPRIERREGEEKVLTVRPVAMEELEQGSVSLEEVAREESFDYLWVGS